MDAHTLLVNYKNNPTEANCISCVEYCYNKRINLNDKNLLELFSISATYLMKYKIGHFTDDDAKLLITFFSNKAINKFGMQENVEALILKSDEYNKKFGNTSNAICVNNENGHIIYYSSNVVRHLVSINPTLFLRGMQTIFHEVVHAIQNNVIKSGNQLNELSKPSLSAYILTIESIVRKADKNFYDKNYSHIYKEQHAEKIGLMEAVDNMKKYNPKLYSLYNEEELGRRIKSYDEAMNANLSVYSMEGSHLKIMDPIVCLFVHDHPKTLEEYPLLKLSYKSDGSKKDILELINDRRSMMDSCENLEQLNDLYYSLCNEKNYLAGGLKGKKNEIELLVEYLTKNEYDDFELNLLKHRLNDNQISENQRQAIINYVINCNAEKHNSIEQEPEKHR